MTNNSKKVLAVLFLVCIFVVSLGTAWNIRGTIKKLVKADSITAAQTKLEDAVTKKLQWHNNWVNINGLFQRCLGVTIVRASDSGDNVYKLSNGQIMYWLEERDMTDYAELVDNFKKSLEKDGIDFTYVQLPFKVQNDDAMPVGTKDYANDNADQLVSLLREDDIDTLDLREEIEKAGFDWDTLFFNTDHHWRPTTGLWASGVIMDHLRDNYDFTVDDSHYQYDSYNSTVYKDYLLGTLARKTGKYYAGLDDLEILEPKFETDFTFYAKGDNGVDEREGDFMHSMYNWDNMAQKASFDLPTYEVYFGKDYAYSKIVNRLTDSDKKILLIGESARAVLLPFMSTDAKEVVSVDLRRYKDKTVLELCEEYQPDVVILAYNPSAFSKEQFTFQ